MNIIHEKYLIEKDKIGSGGFSTVYLGTKTDTGEKVAIKKISLNQPRIGKQQILEKLNSEIEIMQSLDHPNIVKFYDVCKTSNDWYIVMEYCELGTLEDVIKYNNSAEIKNDIEKEINSYYYLCQLRDALNYIRDKNYVHRDIKPSNILLKKNEASGNTFNGYEYLQKIIVKLADFGLSKILSDNNSDIDISHTICGSPLYMAPEILVNSKPDKKSDLWSLGVIMYELLYGKHPFDQISSNKINKYNILRSNLKNVEIDFKLSKNFTPQCFSLLSTLLEKKVDKRISWENFFIHLWFINWELKLKNMENITGNKNYEMLENKIQKSKNYMNNLTSNYNKSSNISIDNKIIKSSYSLTNSNLSKMNFNGFSRKYYKGTYDDYPASYPPLSTISNINNNTRNFVSDSQFATSSLLEKSLVISNVKNSNISDINFSDDLIFQ